ncbi:MAG: S49 family peptidase [Desulfococcaceae bacterium]|jgi:protease-4|nr:S49 family peptidase [Desulfococcaceae bacterium]
MSDLHNDEINEGINKEIPELPPELPPKRPVRTQDIPREKAKKSFMSGLWKAPFKIFAMSFFALLSFVTLLFLFTLFFMGAGVGMGIAMKGGDFKNLAGEEASDYSYISGKKESRNYLLALSVEGIILGSPSYDMGSMGWMGVTYGYEIQKALKEAAGDNDVKGIFLHMQTPGGTIFGSMAISEGIKAFQKETGKPVLVYIEGLAASGGVMSMVGADAVYADYGSMIGSIGVIGGMLTYYDRPTAIDGGLFGKGVVTEGGIEQTVISAGRSKDLGNPFRRPTEEEIRTLQENIGREYENFVRHVALHRNMDEKMITEKMGAQIFDNESAHSFGLIDGTLNRKGAIAKLAEMAGTGEDFQLVRIKKDRNKFWQELLLSLGNDSRPAAQQAVRQDICRAVSSLPLAWHGDLDRLCAECRTGNLMY